MQVTDPGVTLEKFTREIDQFRELSQELGQRGWFMVDVSFPTVLVVMTAVKARPPGVVFGVAFDYTDFDAQPPSVRLVNPFTREPYRLKDLPPNARLLRSTPARTMPFPDGGGQLEMKQAQPLLQGHAPDEVPFLCFAGVREYHDHPGHSGDVWDLHRNTGAGGLVRLLEVIHRYGVDPINGYSVNLEPQIGFQYEQPPE